MTLLKQYMDWATASSKNSSQRFPHLRKRLLLAYLITIGVVFGTSTVSLYIFFTQSLNQQLNNRLLTLAQAAVPSLNVVKTKSRESLGRDLPWRNLFSRKDQALEWFDAEGQLLTTEGNILHRLPLAGQIVSSNVGEGAPLFEQQNKVRLVTIAVYTSSSNERILKLEGFIRASESTEKIEATYSNFLQALILGSISGFFVIFVSSIYLTQQALKPTQDSFQQLKQFTAEASHELRNPLTKISFAADNLLSHPEQFRRSSELKKLRIIKSSTEQMKRLLEDLLFLARTDSLPNEVEVEGSIVSLDELFKPLVDHFKAIAETKKITFQADLASGLTVRGDGSQLSRLFSNLLENAFKYTDVGGSIYFSLEKVRQQALISVRDTGIGIASEYLPFVFQRFWRTERAKQTQEEGLGLGLAIAEAIAHKHQGEISVESQRGIGSCFRVYLPLV
ncbi:MAG: sensor histidine kinase [Xenococcaceae cyanobacterium]